MVRVFHLGNIEAALQVIIGKNAYFFVKSVTVDGW
jgi:hypothetical protein